MTVLGGARETSGTGLLGYVGIKAAASAVGVSPSAIRLWERQGLIAPARTLGGTRRYSTDDVARLRAVRRLRTVDGLNAAAIRRMLDGGGSGAGAAAPNGAVVKVEGAAPTLESDVSVASRLRLMRTARGLTLAAAAERSGLSISFISALERGLSGASVAALRRLLGAYDATMAGLLASPPNQASRLVTASARRVLETGAGVRIENLAEAAGALESHLFVLAPGTSSQGTYSHDGEEFMYVLTGALTVWLDESDEYRLEAGDALTFPSTLAHRFQALGPTETRLLWVNTPPTF